MVEVTEKRCSKCGVVKGVGEFHRDRTRKGGRSQCKTCANGQARKYRAENPDKVKAKRIEYNRRARRLYGDRLRQKNREYYYKNRDSAKEKTREYAQKRPEKVKEYQSVWREKNREKIRSRHVGAISDSYVANNVLGILIADCPPELIERKREEIKTHRILKQWKETNNGTSR